MFALRNFSVCVALVSMAAFSMTGCCSGSCGLLGGKSASQGFSQGISSSAPCTTCGTGASYSAPTQSYATPTQSYSPQSYSTQDFSTQQFSSSVPTSAGSGTVNLPTVQGIGGQSFGGGSLPSFGGSGSR